MEERVFNKQPYPAFFIIVLSLAAPFIFALIIILLLRLVELISGNVSYAAVMITGSFSLLVTIYYLIMIWSQGLSKIIVTEKGLKIKFFIKCLAFGWGEIKEFGRIIRVNAVQNNVPPEVTWDYYLKAGRYGKKISISNSQVKDSSSLCYFVFQRALNAKFVTMVRYPFSFKYIIQEWPKSEVEALENSEIIKRAVKASMENRGFKNINIKKAVLKEALILSGAIVLAFFLGAFILPYLDKLMDLAGQGFFPDTTAGILTQTSRWEIIKMTEFFLVLILYPVLLFIRIIIWVTKTLKK